MMSRYWDEKREEPVVWKVVRDAGLTALALTAAGMERIAREGFTMHGIS